LEPITTVEARVARRKISAEELSEDEGLVRWVVRRQRLEGLSFEDAVQAGRIGLWRALQSYDHSRGARLSTYAVVVISRAVWRAVTEHPLSASPLPTGQARLLALAVDRPDPAERLHRAQINAELCRLVGTLPPHACVWSSSPTMAWEAAWEACHLRPSPRSARLSAPPVSASSNSTSRPCSGSPSPLTPWPCVSSSSGGVGSTISRCSPAKLAGAR